MLKTIKDEFLIKFITTGENSITQLVIADKGSSINILITKKSRVIKRVGEQ